MKYYVEQLDRRHTGFATWQFRLRVAGSGKLAPTGNFHILRSWMIEQYGSSCERDLFEDTAMDMDCVEIRFNPKWCWHVDRNYRTQYIYVQNHEVLSNITIKWTI